GSGRAHTSIQVTPESPGIPHAMVYGLSRALPGARALWPPSPAKVSLHELDTSVEVPGPHVCSVRFKCRRLRHHPRPPHPAPRFVTLRNAPLSGRDGCEYSADFHFGKPEYFFRWGWTNRPNQCIGRQVICPSGPQFLRRAVSHHRRTVMARALPLDSARIVIWNIAARTHMTGGDPMAEASVLAAPSAHLA